MSLLGKYYHCFLDWYTISLRRELHGYNSVLDIGCGDESPLLHCGHIFSVGVDSFLPYIKSAKKKGIHSKYLQADIRQVSFTEHSFDIVMALDVLEHLTREEGCSLIKSMESWARHKVIIFTCKGYVPQDPYDGNAYQEHRSGWQPADLQERGYRVRGMRGWDALRVERADLRFRPAFLWFLVSEITQFLTYWRPELAFQLLCVKNVYGDE